MCPDPNLLTISNFLDHASFQDFPSSKSCPPNMVGMFSAGAMQEITIMIVPIFQYSGTQTVRPTATLAYQALPC
jgi:hypothetical protein